MVRVRNQIDEPLRIQSINEPLDALALDPEPPSDPRHRPIAVGDDVHHLPSSLGLSGDSCFGVTEAAQGRGSVMSEAVEIARFRVAPDAEEGLLAAWPSMVDSMKRAHPGLQSVQLVRFEDGTWADIALWTDREAAALACNLAPPPEVEAFFRHISEDVSMDVATLVRLR